MISQIIENDDNLLENEIKFQQDSAPTYFEVRTVTELTAADFFLLEHLKSLRY